MRVETHLLLFRLGLACALAAPSLHCAPDEEAECGCESSCGIDGGPNPVFTDDDDSATAADDDDSAGDDDDATPEWDATADLPPCAGSIYDLIEDPEEEPAPYHGDGADLREGLATSFESLLLGEAPEAWANARLIGYGLCRGVDDEAGIAVWHPEAEGLRAASVLWRAVGAGPVAASVPRPGLDGVGLSAGLELFRSSRTRVLVLGQTDPCESEQEAACGRSSVCGTEGPVRRSDMERDEETVFQVAHEVFFDSFPNDRWISLVPTQEAGLSVSDGTEEPIDLRTTASDPAAMLVFDALEAAWPGARPTSCNGGLGVIPDPRDCGTDNRQGRLVNGAEALCGDDAPAGRGRFVHLAISEELAGESARLAAILAEALDPGQ